MYKELGHKGVVCNAMVHRGMFHTLVRGRKKLVANGSRCQ